MNNNEYLKLVKKLSYDKDIFKNFIISFISGGLLGAMYEVLFKLYSIVFSLEFNMSIGITTLTFIFITIILTGLGIFDDLVKKYRFGLIIPITGFAQSIMSCIMDYKKEGLISGIGANVFKLAGSVILYGVLSAFVFTIMKVIIYA